MAVHDFSIFENAKTVDFIASLREDSTVHITVFSSVLKQNENTLMFGEYCRGMSKNNLISRKKAAIFALSPERFYANGTLTWRERRNTGPEHEMFNNIPRFRYNATYGYEWIHMLDIESFAGVFKLDQKKEKTALNKTKTLISTCPSSKNMTVIKPAGQMLFEPENNPKLLAYVAKNGYPRLVYIPQARLDNANHVIFSEAFSDEELCHLADDSSVTILSFVPRLGASLAVTGTYNRKEFDKESFGIVDILQVYNCNVPKAGFIYPEPQIETIHSFPGAIDV